MESPLQLSNAPIAPRRSSRIRYVGFGVALLIIWAAYAALTRKDTESTLEVSSAQITRSSAPGPLLKDPEKVVVPPPVAPFVPQVQQQPYQQPKQPPQPRQPKPPRQETEAEKAYKAAVAASPLVGGEGQGAPQVLEIAQQNPYMLDGTLLPVTSPYTILAGTMIPAILQTGVDSEQPGSVFAIVSQNVYDSATQTHLIIPQGAKLQGRYDHETQDGQGRVGTLWERILFPPSVQNPHGSSLVLGGMNGTDTQGAIGLPGSVNRHFFQAFGRALLYAGISAGTGIAQSGLRGRTYYDRYSSPADIATGRLGQELDRQSNQIVRRGEDIRPTITVPQAQTFFVEMTKDVSLPEAFHPLTKETSR